MKRARQILAEVPKKALKAQRRPASWHPVPEEPGTFDLGQGAHVTYCRGAFPETEKIFQTLQVKCCSGSYTAKEHCKPQQPACDFCVFAQPVPKSYLKDLHFTPCVADRMKYPGLTRKSPSGAGDTCSRAWSPTWPMTPACSTPTPARLSLQTPGILPWLPSRSACSLQGSCTARFSAQSACSCLLSFCNASYPLFAFQSHTIYSTLAAGCCCGCWKRPHKMGSCCSLLNTNVIVIAGDCGADCAAQIQLMLAELLPNRQRSSWMAQ